MRLTLVVRAYCHLCEEMAAALAPLARAHGATVEVVDVDAAGNGPLLAACDERVPVLFAGVPEDGRELCHWRLDRRRVEAELAGAGTLARDSEIR